MAELLAREAEQAKGQLVRAYRRAARLAFLWPEEAFTLVEQGRSLTEFPGIGPYLEKRIRNWIETPPMATAPPDIRKNFLTLAEARRLLSAHPDWAPRLRGDLQMHSVWSDGSGSIAEMAASAEDRHIFGSRPGCSLAGGRAGGPNH